MAGLPTLVELEAYRQEAINAEREGRPCTLRDPREVYKEDPNRDSYLVELTDKEISEAQQILDDAEQERLAQLEAVQKSQNEHRENPATKDEDGNDNLDGAPEITDEVVNERLPETRPGETDRRVTLEHGMSEDLYPEPHITSAPDESTIVSQGVQEDLALELNDGSGHQNTQSTPNPEFAGGIPPENPEDEVLREHAKQEQQRQEEIQEKEETNPDSETNQQGKNAAELEGTHNETVSDKGNPDAS